MLILCSIRELVLYLFLFFYFEKKTLIFTAMTMMPAMNMNNLLLTLGLLLLSERALRGGAF